MADMSRAIRLEIEKHSSTLQGLPSEVLRDYVDISGAFYLDLRAEAEKRDDLPSITSEET